MIICAAAPLLSGHIGEYSRWVVNMCKNWWPMRSLELLFPRLVILKTNLFRKLFERCLNVINEIKYTLQRHNGRFFLWSAWISKLILNFSVQISKTTGNIFKSACKVKFFRTKCCHSWWVTIFNLQFSFDPISMLLFRVDFLNVDIVIQWNAFVVFDSETVLTANLTLSSCLMILIWRADIYWSTHLGQLLVQLLICVIQILHFLCPLLKLDF